MPLDESLWFQSTRIFIKRSQLLIYLGQRFIQDLSMPRIHRHFQLLCKAFARKQKSVALAAPLLFLG